MSADVLPGMPEPSPTFETPGRSKGQIMTGRQARDIREGRHPLTGGALHENADRTAHYADPKSLAYRCGSCVHRVLLRHHDYTYPKCDLSVMTHGTATDVRAWWPACPQWEAIP